EFRRVLFRSGRGSVPPQRLSESTPAFAEMAAPGSTFEGEWHERAFLESDEFARALGWRSTPDPKEFIDAANSYAAAQLDLHAQYAETTGLPAVRDSVQRLQQQLAEAQNEPLSCVLCLGRGGGFISKAAFLR